MQSLCTLRNHRRRWPRNTRSTKRTLLLTWAGLAPAGSHQLCLAHSFDHLVGAREERGRYVEAEGLCGLEVDYQVVLGRRLYRQVGGFLALEDAVDVAGRAAVLLSPIGVIGHQAATGDKHAIRVDCG